jgi:hypothetical protein
VLDDRFTIGNNGAIDGVLAAADLVDSATTASDILGGSQRRTSRELHPWMGDAIVLLGPAPIRTILVFAAPPMLVPVQRFGPIAEGSIPKYHPSPALEASGHAAGRAGSSWDLEHDVDLEIALEHGLPSTDTSERLTTIWFIATGSVSMWSGRFGLKVIRPRWQSRSQSRGTLCHP